MSNITPERSASRGRETFESSGRGGLGNIRPSSQSRDRTVGGPDDFSETRGREFPVDSSRLHSTGRGGAGNIRSASRDGTGLAGSTAEDQALVRERQKADENGIHSTGRGGLGNISRSRSRPPTSQVHSTGRGGAGNIVEGEGLHDGIEEVHRSDQTGPHSTGRGGAANLTSSPAPPLDNPHHTPGEHDSTGRGGAGNIGSRSGSRDPAHRDTVEKKHGVAGLIQKVTNKLGGGHHDEANTPTDHVAKPKEGAGLASDGGIATVVPGERLGHGGLI